MTAEDLLYDVCFQQSYAFQIREKNTFSVTGLLLSFGGILRKFAYNSFSNHPILI